MNTDENTNFSRGYTQVVSDFGKHERPKKRQKLAQTDEERAREEQTKRNTQTNVASKSDVQMSDAKRAKSDVKMSNRAKPDVKMQSAKRAKRKVKILKGPPTRLNTVNKRDPTRNLSVAPAKGPPTTTYKTLDYAKWDNIELSSDEDG